MSIELPELKCPNCQKVMEVRVKSSEWLNKHTKVLKKQKYYQYYCEKCDDEETCWTSNESDEMSLNLK